MTLAKIAFKNILVPTDFGAPAKHALQVALALAEKFDANVTLLHACWTPPWTYAATEALGWPMEEYDTAAKKELDLALGDARKQYPRVDELFVAGDPAESILESARKVDADLLVLGTHGRSGLSRVFLGSVAEKVTRRATIPVLTVSGREDGPDTK